MSQTYFEFLQNFLTLQAILNPDVCQETLDEAKIQAKMHMQGVREMRDPEVLLKNQLAYTAAYEGTALAKPIVYSDEEIDSVSLSDIMNHIEKLHDVQNMLIVSVGPKMSRVHDLVEEHFLSNAENKIKCVYMFLNKNHKFSKIR